jgi:hypothetical protein
MMEEERREEEEEWGGGGGGGERVKASRLYLPQVHGLRRHARRAARAAARAQSLARPHGCACVRRAGPARKAAH